MHKYKRVIHIAVALLFTLGVLALAWSYVSLDALKSFIGRVDFSMAAMTVGAYFIIVALRACRFVAAGARLSYSNAFMVAAVQSALLRVMPLRSGELAYGVLLKRMGGGGFGEGVAVVLMLRILDLAAVLPLGAAMAAALLSGSNTGLSMTALCLMGAALMGFFFALGPLSRAVAARVPPEPEGGSPSNLRRALAKVAHTLLRAYDLPVQRRIVLLGLTVLLWAVVIAWLNLCMMAVGAVGVFRDGFAASLLGVLGSILPISLLGSFGPMESGLAIGLSSTGLAREAAAAGSIVVSAVTFIDCWIIGLPAWVALMLKSVGPSRNGAYTNEEKSGAGGFSNICNLVGGLVFSVAGAALLLKRIAYSFETNDQFQYLLLPYRQIFDNFLTGDWFTWQTSHYHVVFSWLICGVHGLTGAGGFPYGVFAIHFLVLFGIAYGLWSLARALNWHWASAAFALLMVAFVRHLGIAGAIVNHGMLLPADMAFPPFLLALAAWLDKRYVRAGLWLGLSGLLHANFAVLGPLVMAPVEIKRLIRDRDWKSTLKMAACYVVLASPTLIVVAKSFVLADDAPGALDVMFRIRSPHHYYPSFAEAGGLFWIVALLAAGLPTWMARGKYKIVDGGIGLLIELIAFQALAGMATALDIGFLIRIFFWRLSIPLFLLAAMAVGEFVARACRSLKFENLLYGAAAVVAAISFSSKGYLRLAPEIELAGFGLTAPFLVILIADAVFISFFKRKIWMRLAAALLSTAFLCWCALISVPGLVVPAERSLNWRQAAAKWSDFKPVNIKEARPDRKEGIYKWIRDNTPKDAVFLAPPGLDDFRLRARRGVFVDWKCCPMKGDEVLEWKRRMLAEMGAKTFPAKGYALHRASNSRYFSRSLKYLADLARKERLTHMLAGNKPQAAAAGLTKLVTRGRWTVYEVE
jgi:hypothetical protein